MLLAILVLESHYIIPFPSGIFESFITSFHIGKINFFDIFDIKINRILVQLFFYKVQKCSFDKKQWIFPITISEYNR